MRKAISGLLIVAFLGLFAYGVNRLTITTMEVEVTYKDEIYVTSWFGTDLMNPE